MTVQQYLEQNITDLNARYSKETTSTEKAVIESEIRNLLANKPVRIVNNANNHNYGELGETFIIHPDFIIKPQNLAYILFQSAKTAESARISSRSRYRLFSIGNSIRSLDIELVLENKESLIKKITILLKEKQQLKKRIKQLRKQLGKLQEKELE